MQQKPSLRYAWYVVFLLTLANVSSFIDRQILSLLVKPIKHDLHLSDTQMSLLLGLSFAIFYTIFGMLIGRMADRYSRRNIIIGGIAVWSLMTALCGGIRTYSQFFLARMGVGVGEATLSPSAYSIIADYFPKKRLATAMSVFTMGIFLGSGLALVVGYGLTAWVPTYFARTFGWAIPKAGFQYGLVLVSSSIAGVLFGGCRFAQQKGRDRRAGAGGPAHLPRLPGFPVYSAHSERATGPVCLCPPLVFCVHADGGSHGSDPGNYAQSGTGIGLVHLFVYSQYGWLRTGTDDCGPVHRFCISRRKHDSLLPDAVAISGRQHWHRLFPGCHETLPHCPGVHKSQAVTNRHEAGRSQQYPLTASLLR